MAKYGLRYLYQYEKAGMENTSRAETRRVKRKIMAF